MPAAIHDRMYPPRAVLNLVWPILIELVLNQTIGVVNSMMVANIGMDAISAVNLVDQINILFINLFSAFTSGITVAVAQHTARGDKPGADNAATQMFSLMVIFSVTMGLIMFVFRDLILNGLYGGAEESVLRYASVYFAGSAISYPFMAAFFACAGALRATGDSRTPMVASVLANIINVAVGAVTIFVFKWGVLGAACAVVAARVVNSTILICILTVKPSSVNIRAFTVKWTKKVIMPVLKISIPVGFDTLIFNGGKLIVAMFMSGMGTHAIAANAIAMALHMYMCIPGNALSTGGIAMVGRTYGVGKFDETRDIIKKISIASSVVFAFMAGMMVLLSDIIIGIYAPPPETYEITFKLLISAALIGPLLWSVSFVLPNCLRGTGDVNYCTAVSISSMCLFRVILAYVLGVRMNMGIIGIWIAMYVDWLARGIMFVLRAAKARWYFKALKETEITEHVL